MSFRRFVSYLLFFVSSFLVLFRHFVVSLRLFWTSLDWEGERLQYVSQFNIWSGYWQTSRWRACRIYRINRDPRHWTVSKKWELNGLSNLNTPWQSFVYSCFVFSWTGISVFLQPALRWNVCCKRVVCCFWCWWQLVTETIVQIYMLPRESNHKYCKRETRTHVECYFSPVKYFFLWLIVSTKTIRRPVVEFQLYV